MGNSNCSSRSKKDETFRELCRAGHLTVARWLYNRRGGGNIDTLHITSAFLGACSNGLLSVAQWLYSLGIVLGMINRSCRRACMVIYQSLNGYIV
jgi:hypothetical protein